MSYNRQKYLALKANHKCVRCEASDERTKNGFTMCEACRNEVNEYQNRFRAEHLNRYKAQVREASHKRYHKLQRQHRCTQCSKQLEADYYYTTCTVCREYQRQYKKKRKKTAEDCHPQTVNMKYLN